MRLSLALIAAVSIAFTSVSVAAEQPGQQQGQGGDVNKPTLRHMRLMSALALKADIG